MLFWLTTLFACQLVGEFVVALSGLPLPGPVIGLVLLFVGLVIRGSIPPPLGQIGDSLLDNLSLLFVPAGTGIITSLALVGANALPIGLAVFVSTLMTIAATGWTMQAVSRWRRRRTASGPDGGEEAGAREPRP